MGDNKNKMPWERTDLDPNSSYAPAGTDTAKIMEQIQAEAALLEEARKSGATTGAGSLETPKSETQCSQLSHGHKLVSLLLACGASIMDIALELGITADRISPFESNRLIVEQIGVYKERFFSMDPQSQLRGMLPDGLKFLRSVLEDDSIVDSEKKLDTVKWLVEKITGKPTQQIDHTSSLNFSHLLDEMKKMQAVRDAMASGSQNAISGATDLRDVTPDYSPILPDDKFTEWASNWKKETSKGGAP